MQFRYDCTIMRSAMQINLYVVNPHGLDFDYDRDSLDFHVIQHANKHKGLCFDQYGHAYAQREGFTYA